MRLRRAHSLTCYWHEDRFVVHPYLGGTPTALHPVAAEVLSAFDSWVEAAKAAEELDHLTPDTVAEAVEALREAGALLVEDGDEAERDELAARTWETWAPEAPFFHYGTQIDAQKLPADRELAREQAKNDTADAAGPQHRVFTEYPEAERVLLPRVPAELDVPLGRALYARRTVRDFTEDPVPLAVLAALLVTTFGPTDFIDSGRSALFRRTSPAGGSRQELDAYVGVLAVEGLSPGFYHYNLREHSLELVSPGLTRDEMTHLGTDQPWVGSVAFTVVLASVIDRMSSKYELPRSYRVSLLNAGHLGQTFALTATALGLGPLQTGAFYDEALARKIGLDNIGSIPVYLLGAGYAAAEQPYAAPLAGLEAFRRTRLT
ncbi:SagB/ThcOx family dehydrogenase [Actinosynnema pretiosum]|uniref:Nitroreductase n=1 Tax=Actinosynnema pretiosum TaxID=42197 RepID=A0A290ZDM0_9PSEU|nr:SagB/ThcOx family dehydrogenase [Actinosynnema pretiosum]ATE57073.1 nitroreductase [Actinosynnema pretiosum]